MLWDSIHNKAQKIRYNKTPKKEEHQQFSVQTGNAV